MVQPYADPSSCVIWGKFPNFLNLPFFSSELEVSVFTPIVRIKWWAVSGAFQILPCRWSHVRVSDLVLRVLGHCLKQSATQETCQCALRFHPKNTYRFCILLLNIVLFVSLNWKFHEAKNSICFISSVTFSKQLLEKWIHVQIRV